jgi:beta-phosphoglucomutase-like phosphatase (HAD superfamily)
MIEAVLLDINGTLIDNNLLHVLAWERAFRRIGKQVDANTILHKVGMGGDQLVPFILGKKRVKRSIWPGSFTRRNIRRRG